MVLSEFAEVKVTVKTYCVEDTNIPQEEYKVKYQFYPMSIYLIDIAPMNIFPS